MCGLPGNLVNGWGNPTPTEGTYTYKDPYGGTQAGWRGNSFVSTHAIFVDHEDNLWLVDHVGTLIPFACFTLYTCWSPSQMNSGRVHL